MWMDFYDFTFTIEAIFPNLAEGLPVFIQSHIKQLKGKGKKKKKLTLTLLVFCCKQRL